MKWFLAALNNYADFSGRARRREYWFFALFFILGLLLFALLDLLLISFFDTLTFGSLYGTFYVLMIVPSLSVSVRRLHDISKSGWWNLLIFIPLVGAIILIVWATKNSQPGTNEYGPNPKGILAPRSSIEVSNV